MSDSDRPAGDHLASITEKFKDRFDSNKCILSFDEYLEIALTDQEHHCRDAAVFLRDAFDYYGSYSVDRPWGQETRFALFDTPFSEGKDKLVGQEAAQQKVYQHVKSFAREGSVDRLILLNGPNGSAKTTLVSCIMQALEHYSTTDEGALYSFNWVFPTQRSSSARIGFNDGGSHRTEGDSYAHLADLDVDARLRCDVHDHPLMLLPPEERKELLRTAAEGQGKEVPRLPELLDRGCLCHKCTMIFEALLTAYHGDLSKVFQHVQVERWFVSRAYRRGAVTIGPQLHVDAAERQISADRSLSALPASLQMTTLFEPHGELVDAAGGVLEFSDLLKRPLDTFRYLLSTIETGEVALKTSILSLNTILMGTTNDTHLAAFREHHEYASFRGRLAVISVPYIKHYPSEQQIYDSRIVPNVLKHVSPHATEAAARWAVLTRLRRPVAGRYEKKVRETIEGLDVADKAELYASGRVPAEVRGEGAEELRSSIGDLFRETTNAAEYEGRDGASPREIRAVLVAAAQDEEATCLSPRIVLEHLRNLCGRKVEHSFLRRKAQPGGFEASGELVEVVREGILDAIEDELRLATGLVAEDRHEELLERYILHVRHWVKSEKIFNKITGKDEESDLSMMATVEENLDVIPAEAEDFRRALMGAIAGNAIEHPGQSLDIAKLFPDHLSALRSSYFAEHRERVARVGRNILTLLAGDTVSPEDDADEATTALAVLKDRFGYCDSCAAEALSDLLQYRLQD